MSQENEMRRAAELFDKAVASLPPSYKALLAGAAFSALNDHGAREMVAEEIGCSSPAELSIAAGIFLDLRGLFGSCNWQSQLAQHIDEERGLDFKTGGWNPAFIKQSA